MLHTHVKSMHAYDSIVFCHCHISSDTSCVCMYHISSEPIRYNEFISCDIIYCQQVHCLRDILLLTMQMHIHFDTISTFRKVKRSCIYPPRAFISISLGRFNEIANGDYVERAHARTYPAIVMGFLVQIANPILLNTNDHSHRSLKLDQKWGTRAVNCPNRFDLFDFQSNPIFPNWFFRKCI